MPELKDMCAELGISHRLRDFVEHGFDTWHTILDITESDLDALGVQLGHRRKLPRRIADSRGVPPVKALPSPRQAAPGRGGHTDGQRIIATSWDGSEATAGGSAQRAKRRYRWHPRPMSVLYHFYVALLSCLEQDWPGRSHHIIQRQRDEAPPIEPGLQDCVDIIPAS
jgi:hypothetical protein